MATKPQVGDNGAMTRPHELREELALLAGVSVDYYPPRSAPCGPGPPYA